MNPGEERSAAKEPVWATLTMAELWRFGLAALTELRRRQNEDYKLKGGTDDGD